MRWLKRFGEIFNFAHFLAQFQAYLTTAGYHSTVVSICASRLSCQSYSYSVQKNFRLFFIWQWFINDPSLTEWTKELPWYLKSNFVLKYYVGMTVWTHDIWICGKGEETQSLLHKSWSLYGSLVPAVRWSGLWLSHNLLSSHLIRVAMQLLHLWPWALDPILTWIYQLKIMLYAGIWPITELHKGHVADGISWISV